MTNKFLLTLACVCCFCIQSIAQTGERKTYVSTEFRSILYREDLSIEVRVIHGENNDRGFSHGTTIYWKIINKIHLPVFLEGTYKAYGSPLKGYKRNKEEGTLPSSKVEPYKTEIFETFAENLLTVTSISAELTHVYKKSDVSSGNGN